MKNNKSQKHAKKFNRNAKYKNSEQIDTEFRYSELMSESISPQSDKSKPRISIMTYIKNIIKSIFFRNNTNKHTTNNQVMNNSEYFLSSQNSSLNNTSSIPSLQGNAAKLTQDNNINAPFSTFSKEVKNSGQDIATDNGRRSSPPTPPRTSSLNKSSSMPSLQGNAAKLTQDNNINAPFSTFGKEVKNSGQDIATDSGRRSSPPTPLRTSSLNKGKGKNSNIRR